MVKMMTPNEPGTSLVVLEHSARVDKHQRESHLKRVKSGPEKGSKKPKRLKRGLKPMVMIGVEKGRDAVLVMDFVNPIERRRMEKTMGYIEPDVIP